jgi:hypothetical protein
MRRRHGVLALKKVKRMITKQEYLLLLENCSNLSPSRGTYLENDYIVNLFLTVLDFRLRSTLVGAAIRHYRAKHWDEIRTFSDLRFFLRGYHDNADENIKAALYLWGYRYWTRLSLLRKLLNYFESIHVLTQQELVAWAGKSRYDTDFKGCIPGMGLAVYQWLVMRQGVETLKPDTRLQSFVARIIKHNLPPGELVEVLAKIASDLNLKASELDWRIWECMEV